MSKKRIRETTKVYTRVSTKVFINGKGSFKNETQTIIADKDFGRNVRVYVLFRSCACVVLLLVYVFFRSYACVVLLLAYVFFRSYVCVVLLLVYVFPFLCSARVCMCCCAGAYVMFHLCVSIALFHSSSYLVVCCVNVTLKKGPALLMIK